jgi:hypothetical protein
MSNHTPNSTPNPTRLPKHVRGLIAGVTTLALGAGGIAGGSKLLENYLDDGSQHSDSHSMSDPNASSKITAQPSLQAPETSHLPTVEESATPTSEATPTTPAEGLEALPGYGNKVTDQERSQIRNSTVKVVKRSKQPGAEWDDTEGCTGLKVTIGGSTYVATARHCFEASIPSGLAQTNNIADKMSDEFGIWTVGSDGYEDSRHTAPVADVSISEAFGPDFALIKVDEANPESANFDKIPAVAYEAGLATNPIPGSEAAIASLPYASGTALVENSGVYLGRVKNPDHAKKWGETFDLVGIDPASPEVDGCNFGASGHVPITAGGSMLGAFSTRFNISNPKGTNGHDDPAQDKIGRGIMAQELGLDFKPFATICAYSVITPALTQNLAQTLK